MTGLDLDAVRARKKLVEAAAKMFASGTGRAMHYFSAVQDSAKDVPDLLAELARYEPAGHGDASYWVHACGWVEVWSGDWTPTDGGCDACESGSDIPADWQPLYIRRGGEPS
jgi:hypothetical protein